VLRLTIALTLLLATPAVAKPGDLDRSFANGGRTAFTPGLYGYAEASAMALDPQGRVLVAGQSQGIPIPLGSTTGAVLSRLTRAGKADGSWLVSDLPGPYGGSHVRAVVALPGGGTLVGTTQTTAFDHSRVAVYAVRPDGTRDPGFGLGGVAVVDHPDSLVLAGLALDGAGRIVLAAVRGETKGLVVRLAPSGTPDATYAQARLDRAPDALLVDRDGSARVGAVLPGHGHTRGRGYVYALDARGSRRLLARLPLRDTDGVAGVTALARGPRGTLLVAGNDSRPNKYMEPHERGWVARIRPDGRVERRTTIVRSSGLHIAAMVRDRRGRVVLAGASGDYELTQAAVARLTPSLRRDRSFGGDGFIRKQIGARAKTRLIASAANAVALDARGRILLAGVAYDDDVAIREDVGRGYAAVARLKG
jgi:uncharacterized delta-60 repeat protein